MATFTIEAAQHILDDLIDRAVAGEEILVMSEDGKLTKIEPVSPEEIEAIRLGARD